MGCSCKDNQQEIEVRLASFDSLRVFFIKRMIEDSETTDRRRRDFNQAIFRPDGKGGTYACFDNTDMEMVLQCFDNAVKDWRRSWCDVENCTRKPRPKKEWRDEDAEIH